MKGVGGNPKGDGKKERFESAHADRRTFRNCHFCQDKRSQNARQEVLDTLIELQIIKNKSRENLFFCRLIVIFYLSAN